MVAKKEGRRPVTRQNPGIPSEQKQKWVTPPGGAYKPSDTPSYYPEGRHSRITPPSNKQFDYANSNPETVPILSSSRTKQRSSSDSSSSMSSTTSTLVPLNTSHSPIKRSPQSNPAVFKEIRDEFASKLDQNGGGGGVMQAWRSNPSSRNQSRNPSRQGSRQSSSKMRRAVSNLTIPNRSSLHEDDLTVSDPDDIVFHSVHAHTLPKPRKIFSVGSSESINDSTHLPSITERDSFSRQVNRKRHFSDASERRTHGRNGYMTGMTALEARTELGVEEVMRELARVANSLKIREMEQISDSNMICLWDGIKIQVSVSKPDYTTCKLSFQWLSGGDMNQFREKRDKLFKRLKL